jgi:hypothetical protein
MNGAMSLIGTNRKRHPCSLTSASGEDRKTFACCEPFGFVADGENQTRDKNADALRFRQFGLLPEGANYDARQGTRLGMRQGRFV